MEAVVATLDPHVSAVERALARCERAFPVLRSFQVTVEILPNSPESPPGYVLLPALLDDRQRVPRGRATFCYTARGQLLVVALPRTMSPGQQQAFVALEDALTAALRRSPRAPKAGVGPS